MSRGNALVLTLAGCFLTSCSKQMPVVSIDPIPNGGVVKGINSFDGSATQNSGIRSVALYLDAKRAADASTHSTGKAGESRWQASIDTSRLPMGVHYLTVMARARDGTFSQETVTIVVSR